MKSLQVNGFGDPPVLCDIARPDPLPGEVTIRIRACGLNFADLLLMKGRYQEQPAAPFTLGMEFSGEIASLGMHVTGLRQGDRVAVYSGHGGLAQYASVPATRCIPIPQSMSFEQAAAFQVAYGTSHLALAHKARLLAGETLLVLGAAGGVGLTAVELGKRMDARVIACARGPEKLAIAQAAGADHLIDSDADDLRSAVKDLGGADVVFDPVGGALFRDALSATRPDGRILLIGFASGDLPEIRPNHLLVKNVSVRGFWWGGYLDFAPDSLADSLKTLFGWFEEGGLRPHISHTLPLAQASDGLELLRSRQSTGKVVITP